MSDHRVIGATAGPPADRRVSRAVGALLALAIAASYANAIHIGFHFDDWHVLERNPHIRSLANVPRFFVDPDTTTVLRENKDLRPVLLTTFALNYALSGDATWSYHLLNLALHWLACVLVFRIVRDHLWLGPGALPIAVAAGLLVAVHPLNTEPVNYVSARSALLTTVFYLGAFDLAVRGRRGWSAGLLALALLTKAIAVTFPLALAGYWLLARRRAAAAAPTVLWSFVVVSAGLCLAATAYRMLLVPAAALAATRQLHMTPWTYFMTEWSVHLYYLRLFLWPDALVIDRLDYPYVHSFLEFQAWGSLLALAALGALAWRARHRFPALTFAALWYVVALAAESSFFPLAEPVNEHRPYLAMLGLGTAAACTLWQVALVAGRRFHAPVGWPFAVVIALVVGVLGAATHARNATWRDDYTLWRDATQKAPANPRAWLNAGHAAMNRGDLDEARTLLMEARRLSPCYAYVHMNLSALAARTGDREDSLVWAEEAVRCNPALALAHHYRGAALERLDRETEALQAYARTTAIDPQHADAWMAQARLHEGRGAWSDAAGAYDRALAADPTRVEAAMGAGLVYHHHLREPARAVECYRRVLRLNPTHYGAHYQLATALLASGATAEAIAAWDRFVPLAEATGDRRSIEQAPEILRTAHQAANRG